MPTASIRTQASAPPAAATTWEGFRILLEQQRAGCVRQQALAVSEAAASAPDPVAVRRAAGIAMTIDEIDAALGQIVDGTYGRCTHCGIDLPVERLEVRPFAAGCVTCQASAR